MFRPCYLPRILVRASYKAPLETRCTSFEDFSPLWSQRLKTFKLQDDDDRQQTSVVATADGSLNQHARSHGPDTASEPGPGAGRARLSDCGALFARPAIRDAVSARAPRGGGVRPLLIDASFCRSLGGSQLRVVAYEVHAAAIVYNKPGRLRDRPMLCI